MKNNKRFRTALVCLLICAMARGAGAQGGQADLTRLPLEDLMNIEITSASRREQRAEDVPAAVYVVTRGDIRRSGARTLPELFRLVPGVQVAQVNANNWAVSVRGFNDLLSNKLLVLIDGRSIYNRAFSGVFWNSLDLLVDDIERIEVIRGPGGSIWGANAVNGVINIVTKTARNSKGALVRVGGGTLGDSQAAVRYGGAVGNAAYRVYSQWSDYGHGMFDRGVKANDTWNTITSGFRLDWTGGSHAVMLDGSVMRSNARPLWSPTDASALGIASAPDGITTSDRSTLTGRWTHTGRDGASLQVQGFMDFWRQDSSDVVQRENVLDLDLQYHKKIADRHDVIVGGGYRNADVATRGSFDYSLTPPSSENAVLNVFGEDAIALGRSLKVTLGSKIERDTTTGWGVQPTARGIWTVGNQRVWGAISRVLRTPTAHDLSMRSNYAAFEGPSGLPILLGTVGNPEYHAEEFTNIEGGYRVELGRAVSVDVTAFRGEYDYVQTSEPLAPVFELGPGRPHLFIATRLDNLMEVDTRGVEVVMRWMPTPRVRFDGSYSGLRLSPRVKPESRDAAAARFDGAAPRHQWQLQSLFTLSSRVELNAALYHVGRLREANVPAYTRADAHLDIKVANPLSLGITGTNLFDSAHLEFAGPAVFVTPTQVPRRATAQLQWRF